MEQLFFIIAALGVLGCSILVVAAPKPMYSLFFMLGMFFFMGALFVLQQATLIAAMNIIVYGGAIMVLFLFVIMLLNLKQIQTPSPLVTQGVLGAFGALIIGLQLWVGLKFIRGVQPTGEWSGEALRRAGNVEAITTLLLNRYLYPFEIISIFLLAAMVGVIALLKRRKTALGEPEA